MSEMISAVLLISLVVAGAAIVSVMLVSTPPPEKIPKVDFQYSNTTHNASFAHIGGDPLWNHQILIRKITKSGTVLNYPGENISFIANSSSSPVVWNNGTQWDYGSFTQVPFNESLDAGYQIIFRGNQGEYLLKEFDAVGFGDKGELGENCTPDTVTLDSDFTPQVNFYNLNSSEYSKTITFSASHPYSPDDGYMSGWFFSSPRNTVPLSAINPAYTFTIPIPNDPWWQANTYYPYNVTHWVSYTNLSCPYSVDVNTIKQIKFIPPGGTADCPDVDFTNSAPTCPGRQVDFFGSTTYSGVPTSWIWTINSVPVPGSQKDLTYTFPADGSYLVVLNVTFSDNFSCSRAYSVEVNCCQLFADFSFMESPAGSGNFLFTDTSTFSAGNPITGWNWDFGDGTTSTLQHPPHQYTKCGGYNVVLTVTTTGGSCGSRTISKPVIVSQIPVIASFTAHVNPVNPLEVTFTDSSVSATNITKWEWAFGDGTKETWDRAQWTTNGKKITHTYPRESDYPVTLKVTTDCGTIDDVMQVISVRALCNITAEFGLAANPQTLNAVFSDLSLGHGTVIDRWNWQFGDGVNNSTQNPTHQYPRLASYTAVLTVYNKTYGCWDSVHKLVFNESCLPVHADFTPRTFLVNANDPVIFTITNPANATTWHWDFGDGAVLEKTVSTPVTHSYTKAGTYAVSLVSTNGCGSSDIQQGTVTVLCPDVIAKFSYRQFIDKPTKNLTIAFTDISPDPANISTWRWDFGDGNYTLWDRTQWTAASQRISHKYPDLAPYTASLSVSNDCGSSNYTYELIYNSTPCNEVLANFTPLYVEDKAPRVVSFSDITPNATRWSWNFGDGYTSEDQNPSHLFNKSGRYTVTLTAGNNCGMTGVKTGMVNLTCPAMNASFGFEYLSLNRVTNNLTVLLTDLSPDPLLNITRWTWNFGDGAKTVWNRAQWNANGSKIAHTYPEVAPYTATLEIGSDCGSTDWTSRLINNGTCGDVLVNFTPLITNGTAPRSVQFTANTQNVSRWNWDFGDGFSSEDQSPVHTYTKGGNFSVTLTGTSDCGTSGIKTGLVNLTFNCQNVTADYGFEYLAIDRPTNNLTVQFTDVSQGHGINITRWTWDFGDGNRTVWDSAARLAASGQIIHKFPEVAPYLVVLTVENECGSQDQIHKLIFNGTCNEVIANFTPLVTNGSAPFTVAFTDLTIGNPTRWHWDFGDGYYTELVKNATVLNGNANHTYLMAGHYLTTLIATGECGKAGVKSGYVDIECPNVSVDFGYTYIDDENKTVNFSAYVFPPLSDDDIIDWTWFFGDGITGKGQYITHSYGPNTEDTTFDVMLIATSYCGTIGQNLKILYPFCPNLTPVFTVTPETGNAPLTVSFTENSVPQTDIISWRWFFGDGDYSYTTDPLSRTPPNHTYNKWGTYYITEQLQNKCGNPFTLVRNVTVTSPAGINGHLWDDLNLNGRQDPGEWDLQNWNITLQERVNGIWTNRTSVRTNASGWYNFSMPGLTYGIFRVTEDLPAIWNTTTSYGVTRSGPDKNPTTGTILIYTDRFFRADFGNVDWHVSSMQFPVGFIESSGDLFRLDRSDYYWGYWTSFNPVEQQIHWYQNITYHGGHVFQVPPYARWGNSSFSINLSPYSAYLIRIRNHGSTTVTIDWADWITKWTYVLNGVTTTYLGKTFPIPDNTTYTGDKLTMYMVRDNTPYTMIDPPYEGQVIPYNQHFGALNGGQYNFSCHVVGAGTNINTTMITPVVRVLDWLQVHGYFILDWDNRLSEGQNVMFTTQSSFHAPSNAVIRAYRNVSVDFQPLTPTFINVTRNVTTGYITVNAHVKGHNYDLNNVSIVIGNASIGTSIFPMTWTNGLLIWDAGWNNSTVTFNGEPMAGRTVPIVIRATPVFEGGRFRGKTIDSAIQFLAIPSISPINASFTADPWSGPAPLEVAFTDTSTGGPGRWDWNFGDGTPNITGTTLDEKNPVHLFNRTGTFPVTLTVRNIANTPSSYQRYVTVTNSWHKVNLFTSRSGSLVSGGSARWIVSGSGSSIVVNGVTYSLKDNDNVQLSLLSPQYSARILVSGGITAFNCTNVQLAVNGVNVQQGDCTGINILDYTNFHSSLKITTARDNAAWANLIWDGVPTSVPTTRNLDISDLMPNNRFMDFSFTSGQIYFDGNASQYQLYR